MVNAQSESGPGVQTTPDDLGATPRHCGPPLRCPFVRHDQTPPEWELSLQWKEEAYYWEGKRGYLFMGGWGVIPPVTYVPDAEHWDANVPAWMRGRRDEILARLRSSPHHVVEEIHEGWMGTEVSR